jgi:hypothetical protein
MNGGRFFKGRGFSRRQSTLTGPLRGQIAM